VPVSLQNTATADAYPAPGAGGAQVAGTDIFESGWFIVANASAICEYTYGLQGQYELAPEIFLAPGNYPLNASVTRAINGIRFRSAVTGKPAQVFGTFFYPTDPTIQSSSEFLSQVAANGGVTPPASSSALTGQIASAGTVTAGTGFTVSSHPSAGVYVIVFTTAFAATPTIVTTIFDSGGGQHHAMDITAQSASGFSVKITDNVGTPQDNSWNFIAQTTA
jgi:hypothetical protein